MFANQSFLFAFGEEAGKENEAVVAAGSSNENNTSASTQFGTGTRSLYPSYSTVFNLSTTAVSASATTAASASDESVLYPIEWVVPITVVYGVIFVFGLVGNVSTCIVIARNKSLHTVTNYYLFSIAISDLLLLISGLPPEMYRIWSPKTYVFGQAFCILQSFAAETSANATVLTITAFTVERYLAICHPFLSHTVSNLSRAVKYILAIWICALCLAAPQAIQFGVEYEMQNGEQLSRCTVVAANSLFRHAFEISTFVIFVGPMTLITLLYILIAIKLNKSKMMRKQRASLASGAGTTTTMAAGSLNGGATVGGCGLGGGEGVSRASRKAQAQNRVIKMLVAVVVAFFICWAPFHAQRLLAVYLSAASAEAQKMCIDIYIALMYISGVLYFLSTSVNPILYHIMSNKFRQAFKNTFYGICSRRTKEKRQRTYSVLSRCPPSLRHYQRSISDGVHSVHQVTPPGHGGSPKDSNANSNGEHLYMMEYNNQTNRSKCTRVPPPHHLQRSQSRDTTLFTTLTTISCQMPANETRRSSRQSQRSVQSVASANGHNAIRPHANAEQNVCLRRLLRLFNNNNRAPRKMRANSEHGLQTAGSFAKRHASCLPEQEQLTSAMAEKHREDDISNSSLQDCDDMEYSSSDLVKYMEEVNVDLGTATNT